MIIIVFLFIVWGLCGTALAAEHINPPPLEHFYQQDAERFYESSELLTLQSEGEDFYVFHQPYMAAAKTGTVVLIPDMLAPPLNSSGISFLAQRLSDDGFDTYTISAPAVSSSADILPPDLGAATPEENQQAGNKVLTGVSERNLDDYKTALISRFEALYNTLSKSPEEQLVVVAFGNSAGVFVEHLATLPSLQIDAVTVISPQLPNAARQKHLAANLSLVSPALLDIYYSFDNPSVVDSTNMRKRWALRNNKYDYRQRELFGVKTDPLQHQRLRKELLGFLRVL